MAPDVTVHHYTTGSNPSASQTILDSALELLNHGVISTEGWHTVHPTMETGGNKKGVCYQWRTSPPVTKGKGKACCEELLDWDAPLEDDEEYADLVSLKEFESTDFGEIFRKNNKNTLKRKQTLELPLSVGPRNFAADVDMNREERAAKRLRSSNDPTILNTSISELIPFPHYHASPDHACPPPPGINLIPPFKVVRPLSRSIILKKPYARTAWIVPLRGGPTVEGTSRAYLCMHTSINNMTTKGSSPPNIQWTPLAITQFWSFLLLQRTMNNFGPLSVAYIMASGQVSGRKRPYFLKFNKTTNISTTKPTKSSEKDDGQKPTWEYIKIYHDARYSLKIRSLLDSFRWEDTSISQATPSSMNFDPKQYRVLKGASLVLVDEIGEPLLLS